LTAAGEAKARNRATLNYHAHPVVFS